MTTTNFPNGIGQLAGVAMGATIGAPAAEAADARSGSIQLTDQAGDALTQAAVVQVYVATDAAGMVPGDGDATIVLTAGTDGALISADESGATMVSEADGDLDVVLTDSADADETVYLVVVLPTVQIAVSDAIAFVDDTP